MGKRPNGQKTEGAKDRRAKDLMGKRPNGQKTEGAKSHRCVISWL